MLLPDTLEEMQAMAPVSPEEALHFIQFNGRTIIDHFLAEIGDLVVIEPDRITFFGDTRFVRLPDQTIEVTEAWDVGLTRVNNNVPYDYELTKWLTERAVFSITIAQIRLLRELTGLDFRMIDHFGQYTIEGHMAEEEIGLFYGDRIRQAVKEAGLAIRRMLGKKIIHFGNRIACCHRIWHYNLIRKSLAEWEMIVETAPKLSLLVWYAAKTGKIQMDGHALQHLRELFIAAGHSPLAWRLFCQLNEQTIRYIGVMGGVRLAVAVGGYLADIGSVPDATLLHETLQVWMLGPVANRMLLPVWFTRAAMQRLDEIGADQTERQHFIYGEIKDLLPWLRHCRENGIAPDANARKQGWGWVARQSSRWFGEEARNQVDRHLTWESASGPWQDEGFTIVPLVSSEDLAEEGRLMRHCAATLDLACHDHYSRIFSIRKGETHLATLELVRTQDPKTPWQLGQYRGPYNNPVDADLAALGGRVVAHYNAVERLRGGPPALRSDHHPLGWGAD